MITSKARAKANKKHWVGFDLGGTKMLAQVYDSRFKCLGEVKQKSKGMEGAKNGLRRIIETIQQALCEANVPPGQLAGIGIAVPGPINPSQGVVIEMPNLGWHNMNLRIALQKVFKCPIHVLNDVDAGTYGEYRFGAGKGAHCVVGIFPGSGIGGGCVYNGELLQGASRSCMEIGHIQVQPNGALCGCGRHGCLETLSSRIAISAAAAAAAYRGQAPALLKAAGTSLKDIRSGVLAESIRGGDKAVIEIVNDAAYWLGVAVGNVVNLINPDVIVLGGGLVTAIPRPFLRGARAGAEQTAMRSFNRTYTIAIAELGDNATAQGAAAWAMQKGR